MSHQLSIRHPYTPWSRADSLSDVQSASLAINVEIIQVPDIVTRTLEIRDERHIREVGFVLFGRTGEGTRASVVGNC